MSEEFTFIQNRKNTITKYRIEKIIWYIIECYLLVAKNKEKYSKIWVKENTTLKFENFLRNRFVEDYLSRNKTILIQEISCLNEINFTYETEKEYIDTQDNKIKSDKIDIYINKLGLQNEWKNNDENIYFALECKRIEKLSDVTRYISDIRKFVNRKHMNTRLPFEGQIAFIENKSICHKTFRKKVNCNLKNNTSIITKSSLDPINLNDKYDGSYLSEHQRKTSQQNFSIYHLFFDYSNIVVN
jgi:hypothetical protein